MKIVSSKTFVDEDTFTPWREFVLQVPIEKILDSRVKMTQDEYTMFIGDMFLKEMIRFYSESEPNETTKRAMEESTKILNESSKRFED